MCAEDTFEHRASPLYEMLKNLYGLIHARFIGTSRGLGLMVRALLKMLGDAFLFARTSAFMCRPQN
jgi:hypothetical protein